jgi:hypothetical protein
VPLGVLSWKESFDDLSFGIVDSRVNLSCPLEQDNGAAAAGRVW